MFATMVGLAPRGRTDEALYEDTAAAAEQQARVLAFLHARAQQLEGPRVLTRRACWQHATQRKDAAAAKRKEAAAAKARCADRGSVL